MSVADAVKPTPSIPSKDHPITVSRTEQKNSTPVPARTDDRTDVPNVTTERPSTAPDEQKPTPKSSPTLPTTGPAKDDSEATESSSEGIIDMAAFEQILDLDEDDDHDFSSEMVTEYFSQATQTFINLEVALKDKNLTELSSLGHFLKGSSATLGVEAVRSACEKIQHYGDRQDGEGGSLTAEVALGKITDLMSHVQQDYQIAEKWFRDWYKAKGTVLP